MNSLTCVRKVSKKTCIISILTIIATGILAYMLHLHPNISLIRSMLCCLVILVGLAGIICLFILLGNFSDEGMLLAYMNCKARNDWLNFANHYVIKDIDSIILSKRLDIEQNEIYEVCLESKELRCRNIATGKFCIMELEKTFEQEFEIKHDESLRSDEIIIDLSKNMPVAYVNINK